MKKALITLGIAALLAGCGTDVPTKPIEDREPKEIGEETEQDTAPETEQASEKDDELMMLRFYAAIPGIDVSTPSGNREPGGECSARADSKVTAFNAEQVKLLDQNGTIIDVKTPFPGELEEDKATCVRDVMLYVEKPSELTFFTLEMGNRTSDAYRFEGEDMQVVIWEMYP